MNLAFCTVVYSQSVVITGHVVDKDRAPISDACVMVYSQDSTLVSSGFSGASGEFRIEADSVRSHKIRVSCLGYETVWRTLPIDGTIELTADSYLLSEIVVKERRNFTQQTSTGFVYNLSNIDFVKYQSLFQAFRLVPFVDIDNEGRISVRGDKRYVMCLNGKPFDIGMANPMQVLQSIRAKDVKKIEVITEPDLRFNNTIPVINIVTAPNSLDGIYVHGSAKYATVSNAKAGASFLTKAKHLDFSCSYNYDYQSQRKQPIFQSVMTNDGSSLLEGQGDGHWHTHLVRALTSWRVDSLNVIYADIHAKMNNDNYKTTWIEQDGHTTRPEDGNLRRNQSSATKGVWETNLIYRNYFRHDSKREHFMVGYRYAYNPDKRNYTLTDGANQSDALVQKTNGGVNEHTINLQAVVPVASRHQLSLGARTIYRKADTHSTDNSDLSYSQSISYPYLNYTGSFGRFNVAMNLSCEYEYLSMYNPHESSAGSRSENLYILPSLHVYRSFDSWRVSLSYGRSLQRPSIVMLNPFYNSENDHFYQIGNPNLKAEMKDDMTIGASLFKKGLSLSLGVSYSHTDNAILYYQKELSESGAIISSYANIGRLNTFTGNVFINWQPVSPLVLKLNINGGSYNLSSVDLNLSQKDYTLNVFGWIDYYLRDNWNIGANVMHYKQSPEPFGTVNSITNYSIHIERTWLKGRLLTTVEIASPFDKYSKLKTTVNHVTFSTEKVNYMTTRYIGFNISYTFQQGQRSKLKRDSSLINADQNSGVQ